MSNSYFESLKQGLLEAVDDAKNEENQLKRRKRTIITPVKRYTSSEVKRIRNDIQMTQNEFASYLGVSLKTVEAWESGKNTPSGCASRLLSMFEMNKNLAKEYPFIQIE
ncbi:MAG: helix-turn-helix domain-containing protein [Solobacterium sp.]|nr:helix-turn-helix domain-containing protein [Solobacterium sp.]